MARRTNDGLQTTPNYDEASMFSLKIVHGGVMEYMHGRNYKGGSTYYFDHVDGDMLGLIELRDFAEQLGYNADKVKFWHQFGESLEKDAKLVETDVDVYSILKNPPSNGEVLIFFDHTDEPHLSQPTNSQPTQACLTQVEPILSQPTNSQHTQVKSNNPTAGDDELYQKLLKTDVVMEEADMEDDDESYIADSDVSMKDDDDSDGEGLYDQFVDSDASQVAECDELYQKILVSDCELDESDESYVDSGLDSGDDDKLFHKSVDPQAENQLCDNDLKDALVNEQMLAKLVGDNEAFANSSDEFDSLPSSDEDGDCHIKFPKFNPLTEARKPDLKIGAHKLEGGL
ncbi:hypothetical protein CASFOL_030823 [Castilleja foliolosa]|uniref:PB1-like domain-containing protein n=1 Tax=Castilleja foliolosa TaxID=1961234 RepID=A0ABD3C7G5_9LAMI